MRKARRNVFVILALVFLPPAVAAQTAGSGKCTLSPDDYQREKYVISNVRLDTPLDWLFGSISEQIKQVLASPDMPVKVGKAFVKGDYFASFIFVKQHFPELTVSKAQRVGVRLARPGLANCNDQAKTLDIVYHVYTFGFPYYLSRAFETGAKTEVSRKGTNEVSRSVVDASATETLAHYFPVPYAGYNRSRAIYGGSSVSLQQPGGLLNNIELEGSGSSSSAVGRAEGNAAHDYGTGFIRHLEYQFRYYYADLPGQQIKLKQGFGLGQFYAATRVVGPGQLVFRFGGLIEGGNKITDVDPARVAPGDLVSTPFGSIKTFVGANLRVGKQANPIKVSYGLQLGSARENNHLDYVKQVFDSAADLRFPFGDHKAFTAYLQFTAGKIHTRGKLPVVERFFGGNAEQNFTATDSWVIRSDPFIRSFPQNTFDRNSANGILGGDRFFSANMLLGVTVWSKPLVPTDLADKEFRDLAKGEFDNSEGILKMQYLMETDEGKAVAEQVPPLLSSLEEIEQELNSIDSPSLPQPVKDQITATRAHLDEALATARKINATLKKGDAPQRGDLRNLVAGFPALDKPPTVTSVIEDLQALIALPSLPPNHFADKIARLEPKRKDLADSFAKLISSEPNSPDARAAARAKQDMVYARRVFEQLLDDANIIAFSPVVILDAARLWQFDRPGKVRYAMGPGLRVSVVSLDVTAGYAWNPNRQPWESKGAFLFRMEASNLFR